jgi:23S rRNA pseudouridine2605 synthase
MRIAKAMARAGLCSRRDAERWITEGRVKVNGETLTSPARDVGPKDRIIVDGAPLPAAEPTRLWRYAKPKGLVTTHRDPEGRPTVFDNLPEDMPRVVSIGRLDVNTEGLLLLTTDGELARYLELPATGWLRRYRVRAHVKRANGITQADLDELKDGISVDGIHYGPVEATLDSTQGANVWLTIGLREGKNREVRNILSSLDLEVNRLIRVSFGPFQLLDLEPGKAEQVRRRTLVEQLSPRLASRFALATDDDEDAQNAPQRSARKPRSTGRSPEPSRQAPGRGHPGRSSPRAGSGRDTHAPSPRRDKRPGKPSRPDR